MLQKTVLECAKLIQESNCVAALTGAGISTNAGIPDFRGPQGLYVTRRYDPDIIFDFSYFLKDPQPFYQFAKDFLTLQNSFNPTPTHHFLSRLEACGKLKGIVTQNIDSLHQKAGSSNVYEMHGSFQDSYCLDCDKKFSYETMVEKILRDTIPQCECGGIVKPDIVFFGENIKKFTESMDLAQQSDLFFVIGTSCVVYPAAVIPTYVGGKIIIVNHDPVDIPATNVVLSIQDDIDRFFNQLNVCLRI